MRKSVWRWWTGYLLLNNFTNKDVLSKSEVWNGNSYGKKSSDPLNFKFLETKLGFSDTIECLLFTHSNRKQFEWLCTALHPQTCFQVLPQVRLRYRKGLSVSFLYYVYRNGNGGFSFLPNPKLFTIFSLSIFRWTNEQLAFLAEFHSRNRPSSPHIYIKSYSSRC